MFSSRTSIDEYPPENSFDVLVVGHGLAGAILVRELKRAGLSVFVIDLPSERSASRVAAGIINPITGHRLNITDGFHTLFPDAIEFYQQVEAELGTHVFTPVSQTRLIKNQGQWEYYQKRRKEAEYINILGVYKAEAPWFRDAPFGVVEIKQSGVVNTNVLLDACTKALQTEGVIEHGRFDYQALTSSSTGFTYAGKTFRSVVFCEGQAATSNPWLQHLPFKLSKGEIIDLELTQPMTEFLNWGHWLVPQADTHRARLGSTYEWQDLDSVGASTERLMQSMHKMLHVEAQVLNCRSGIRPTTRERKPFIGEIPQLRDAYCFNGFGSKGCLLIPHYAKRLIAHMTTGATLPKEVTKWV